MLITAPVDERLAVRGSHRDQGAGLVVRAQVLGRDVTAVTMQVDDAPPQRMTRVAGEVALWSTTASPLANGVHTVRVAARGAAGFTDSDEILVRVPLQPKPMQDLGQDTASVGAWPARGLLGTRLGPNANGKKW